MAKRTNRVTWGLVISRACSSGSLLPALPGGGSRNVCCLRRVGAIRHRCPTLWPCCVDHFRRVAAALYRQHSSPTGSQEQASDGMLYVRSSTARVVRRDRCRNGEARDCDG